MRSAAVARRAIDVSASLRDVLGGFLDDDHARVLVLVEQHVAALLDDAAPVGLAEARIVQVDDQGDVLDDGGAHDFGGAVGRQRDVRRRAARDDDAVAFAFWGIGVGASQPAPHADSIEDDDGDVVVEELFDDAFGAVGLAAFGDPKHCGARDGEVVEWQFYGANSD